MAGKTMSISDLLGLNAPRGLLGNSFGNSTSGHCTPPPSSGVNFQVSTIFNVYINNVLLRSEYQR